MVYGVPFYYARKHLSFATRRRRPCNGDHTPNDSKAECSPPPMKNGEEWSGGPTRPAIRRFRVSTAEDTFMSKNLIGGLVGDRSADGAQLGEYRVRQ